VFAFRRCLLVNGIDIGAMRGDYAERSLVVDLERIPPEKRRAEGELAAYWNEHYPRVFGALLDLAADVKAALPSVVLDASPRMADFARVLAAVDQVLGTAGSARYLERARSLAVESLESDPFLIALVERITFEFIGTAAELLARVRPDADGRLPEGWPKGARAVTGVLKRNAPALRADGWSVDEIQNGKKSMRWRLTPSSASGDHSSSREDGEMFPPSPVPPSPQVRDEKSAGGQSGEDLPRSPVPPQSPGERGNGGNPEMSPRPSPASSPADRNAVTSTNGSKRGKGGTGERFRTISGGRATHPDASNPCTACGKPLGVSAGNGTTHLACA
jgi:hypothetical protein